MIFLKKLFNQIGEEFNTMTLYILGGMVSYKLPLWIININFGQCHRMKFGHCFQNKICFLSMFGIQS